MSSVGLHSDRYRPIFLALFVFAAIGQAAAEPLKAASEPAVCTDVSFDSDDDSGSGKGKKKGSGVRFELAGACAKVSGSLAATNQNNLQTTAGGAPGVLGGRGTPTVSRTVNSIEADGTLETNRKTGLGDLETTFSARWIKSSDDGTTTGTATVQEWKASLSGVTAGYTDSLMNFWNEDFLFKVTAAQRTVGVLSYEHDVTDDSKLAIAIESGLPTSRQYTDGLRSIDFDSPLLTARWLYQNDDDWSAQLSGLVRQAKFTADPTRPFLPQTSSTTIGWAINAGATIPTKFVGDSDYVSTQATYAVNASPFLGTNADLSTLSTIVPATGTSGWSAIASFHHEWSDKWESNVFASYLALTVDLLRAQPAVRTMRYAANVYWRPVDQLRLGAEIGQVTTEIGADRAFGALSGLTGRGVVGYLNVQWTF